jgi:hypothetical protein
MKRGSDSLLEAKLRDQLSKPRSMQNRAQSLDLTSSLSRITEGAGAPLPESPTDVDFGGDGGGSAPHFPSVYGEPPASGRSSGGSGTPQYVHRSGGVMDDESAEEMSRMISTLGL